MASCFRILCALSDQRALCASDEQIEDICSALLDGSSTPVPNLTSVKYLLSVLQGIHDCLVGDESSSISTTNRSREPSLLRRTVSKDPTTKTSTDSIHESVASSVLSKSMLDHPVSGEKSTEKAPRNEVLVVKNPPQKKAQRATYSARELAEKNQHAIDKYVERMNRAYIMRTGPTRLEVMNGDVPLSHRRAREIRSTQELEQYLDLLDNP